jgi:large subunit ribosomal protein L32
VALPKRKTPRAKRDHRRSHHHIAVPQLVTCTQCRSKHINHRPCTVCGTYNGRQVLGSAPDEA